MTSAGWQSLPLGSLAHIRRGSSPRPISSPRWFDSSSEVGWVRIGDVADSDGRVLRSTTQRLSSDGIARSRLIQPGTLIMSIAATVGRPVITGFTTCIHDGFVSFEQLRGVDREFLFYVLKGLEESWSSAGQTGSQTNVNTSIVSSRQVTIPVDESEQRLIAMALGDVDDQISLLLARSNKMNDLRQGVVQALLSGATRLPGFSKEWSTTTLGALGVFLKGRGIRRDDVRGLGIPCIRYGELYTAFADYTDFVKSFVDDEVASSALPLKSGDVLFAGSGETREDIGKCVAYLGPTPAVAGGDVIVLRGELFNPLYLALLANSPEIVRQKARAGQGDAVVHIYPQALAAVELSMPPRDEQDAIVRVVRDLDDQIACLDRRLRKARRIKQGMMQELLTGRIRLLVEEAAA